jgi:hypothetical protein
MICLDAARGGSARRVKGLYLPQRAYHKLETLHLRPVTDPGGGPTPTESVGSRSRLRRWDNTEYRVVPLPSSFSVSDFQPFRFWIINPITSALPKW